MSTPRLPDYLQHIRLAAHQAETYIEGVELDEFLQNDFVQNAVRSTLITIGEAATRIINKYPDFVAEHPEVPWHVMRGMRNQIAHGYFDIDYETVYDTVTQSIPEMLQVLPVLPLEPDEDDCPGMDGP